MRDMKLLTSVLVTQIPRYHSSISTLEDGVLSDDHVNEIALLYAFHISSYVPLRWIEYLLLHSFVPIRSSVSYA